MNKERREDGKKERNKETRKSEPKNEREERTERWNYCNEEVLGKVKILQLPAWVESAKLQKKEGRE